MPHTELENIGLCEHCGQLIAITDYTESEGSEVWLCKHCGQVIGHSSFGFDQPETGCKKVRWVGPGGQWVDKKPDETFNIEDLTVFVHSPRFAR